MVAPTRGFATYRTRTGVRRLRAVRLGLRARTPAALRRHARRVDAPQVIAAVAVLLVAALLLQGCGSTQNSSPGPAAASAAAPTAATTVTPAPTPTPTPTPTPEPKVNAPTNGVLETAAEAARPVVAVMIDDAPAARPQSGLAGADVFIQAPAEGGIPRYLALYQSHAAPAIGPIRSSRRYFVGWAAAWKALYAHVGGAPNALAAIRSMNGSAIWDADEYTYASYMPRIATRYAPHNCYSSTARLDALAKRLGVPAAPATSWTFTDAVPLARRAVGGTLVVPYPANLVAYAYDRATNTYLRSVDGAPQIDAGTGSRVAPSDVVVMYVAVGPLANAPGASTNEVKGRLEMAYIGSGRALVLRNGAAVQAAWSKASDDAPILLTYASGSRAGQPVALIRGQIAIQVVPIGTGVTYRGGKVPSPSPSPSASAAPTPSPS